MVKVRLQGTPEDLKKMCELLEMHPNLLVTEKSGLYINKGTVKYYRQYMCIEECGKRGTYEER